MSCHGKFTDLVQESSGSTLSMRWLL